MALYAATDYVTAGNLPDEVGQFTPFILFAFRSLEGLVDKIDTAKQRQRDAIRDDPAAPGYDL